MLPRSCSQARSTAAVSTSPFLSIQSVWSPRKPASSALLGLQISIYGNAFVQFRSSSGMQRSGTGSQMKTGFSANGCSAFLFLKMEVTRLIHRVGEHIR
jgi:hypothetical protein